MKKTASKILLSTLAVVTSISGVGASLMSSNSAWAVEDETNIIVNSLDELGAYLQFEYIDPNGGIRFSFNQQPVEFWLGYLDYEHGVSEAVADALLSTLGQGDDDWFVTIRHDDKTSFWHTVVPTKPAKLSDNESEIIYFALRYGDKVAGTDEVQNEYWVRGKIDYRRCYHSMAYQDGMYCRPLMDNTTGELTFLPVDTKTSTVSLAPEGEVVMTWEAEWRQILKRRSETMLAIIKQFDQELPNVGKTILEQFETDVRNLKILAGSVTNTDTVRTQTEEILRLVTKVREKFSNSIGENQLGQYLQLQSDYQKLRDSINSGETGDDNNEDIKEIVKTLRETIAQKEAEVQDLMVQVAKLKQENTDLTQANTTLADENQCLKQSNGSLVVENQRLKEENVNLTDSNQKLIKENASLQARIKALEVELAQERSRGVGEIRVNTINNSSAGNSQGTASAVENAGVGEPVEVAEMNEVIETTNAEVEVPNLGEVDTRTNWWWIAAGVMALCGSLGLWCKRHFGRR